MLLVSQIEASQNPICQHAQSSRVCSAFQQPQEQVVIKNSRIKIRIATNSWNSPEPWPTLQAAHYTVDGSYA